MAVEGIINLICQRVETALTADLITAIGSDDPTVVGAIKIGPLQGEPDPDVARISIEVHHNDPDDIDGPWRDVIEIVELGGVVTWSRKFTLKIRCLFENSREDAAEARRIAATVRDRVELVLLKELFTGVATDDEYVSRPAMARTLQTDMLQGGGPPDAFDYHIKSYFEVWTTRTGVFA